MKIPAENLRAFKKLHTWTGLAAGLLLFIAFYAGALTLFREDIARWQHEDAQVLTEEALALAPVLMEAALAADPEAIHGMRISLPGGHVTLPMLQWRTPEGVEHVTLNALGQVSVADPSSHQLSMFIDNLHRYAGIPGLTGEWLMGIAALIYGLALVSGIVLYLPVLSRDLFALRLGKGLKRRWLDIHNSLGILSLPFHLLFALTGAVMLLHDPMFWVMDQLIYPEQGRALLMQSIYPVAPPEAGGAAAAMLPLTQLLANVRAAYPDFTVTGMIFMQPDTVNATVSFLGDMPQRLAHQAMIVLSGVSGEILGAHLPGQQPDGITALSGFIALHFGDYGGRPLQWLYFVLALAGSLLFYTGNLLWLEARRKRQQALQPKAQRWLAGITLGVCLGCCGAISVLFLVARTTWVQTGAVSLATLYWSMLALCVLWACSRPPVLAARSLLWLNCIAALLIPISSVWVGGLASLSGVEAVACGMAGVFGLCAYQVGRRIHHGEAQSIWALPASA